MMADMDALREALLAALAALDGEPERPEPAPENETADERKRRLARERASRYRRSKRDGARDESVTESVTTRDESVTISRASPVPTLKGGTGDDAQRDLGRYGVTQRDASRERDADGMSRAGDLIVAAFGGREIDEHEPPAARDRHSPHDVTGPVKRCPRCSFPMADIRGEIVCLECESRDNYGPTSDAETAAYWHERIAETVRNAIPTVDAASLEARSKRLGIA